jgi:hypothetical protein
MNLIAWVRERRERLLERPFWRLVAHFGQRLFAGGDSAGEGELSLGVAAMLALLATPGLFITVLRFGKYSSTLRFFQGGGPFDPYVQSIPDQYFYFAFSMAITGVVVALKWDSILPGRQDYMNLAPLPVRTRNIFLANLIAIVVIAVLFAVDVNAVSSLLFPLLVTMEFGTFRDYVVFVGAHALGVMLCSLFIFFALFALIGLLMAVLPSALFRRFSLYLRVAVVVGMLTMLVSSFALPQLLRLAYESHSGVLRWMPPVWFLALARSLIGKGVPRLAGLGVLGLRMIVVAMALAIAAYVISYYRYFIRIPEKLDTPIRKREPRPWVPPWLLDGLLLRSPFERACYRFTLKTLLRNERQLLFLGALTGLGLVLASQTLVSAVNQPGAAAARVPSAELLSVPLIVAYFVLCGLRFVFELPAELGANWAPQVIVDRKKHRAAALARKAMLSLVWPWLILVGLPLYAWFSRWTISGWKVAVGHTAVVMVWTWGLADLLLRRFRKIPFTCAYPPMKQGATAMIVVYSLGFVAFTSMTAGLEHALLARQPLALWFLAPAGFGAWKLFLKLREDELDPTDLIFEDAPPPALELLNLSGR